MSKLHLVTLNLFNCVVKKNNSKENFIKEHGVFVTSSASYAISSIRKFLNEKHLSGDSLNKTFHKSWELVKKSSREELATHQILHYLSTYGSNFESEVYIPSEVFDIPEKKMVVKIIDSLSKEELIDKCLDLLASGIALKEDTLNDLFFILNKLDYKFTGKEVINNKEAMILIAHNFKILPDKAEDILRYLVYCYTGTTSLVKNEDLFNSIKENKRIFIDKILSRNDILKLSSIFNRYKKIFLSIKLSNKNNKAIINKISKLSKKNHKPMPFNPLNLVTRNKLKKEDIHWLDNANIYSIFKALSSCHQRIQGQTSFVYRIRNGKSWAKKESNLSLVVCKYNYDFILSYIKKRFSCKNKVVFIPEEIKYALPTSEKMFVGNIPTGTKFSAKRLAAGVYWENSWGACDIDLSGLNIGGKIGWNSDYYNQSQQLAYSGDLTSAPNGAVEYLHSSSKGDIPPTLVCTNIFSGNEDAGYKIIIGKGDKVSRKYMMNPNNLIAEIKTNSVQKNSVLGMLQKEEDNKVSFVLLNFGAGNARVSGHSSVSLLYTKALYEQWNNAFTLNILLKEIGFNVVSKIEEGEKIDFDLSVDKLNKSTFIDLFK